MKIVPVELGLTLEQERRPCEQIQTRLAPPEGQAALKDPKDAAEVKRAEADRTDAEQKYQRAKELFDQGLISRGDLRRGRGALQRARAPATTWRVQNVRTLRAQAAQRTASVALAEQEARRHRDPRALRRTGEGAHGEPRPVREGADPGHGASWTTTRCGCGSRCPRRWRAGSRSASRSRCRSRPTPSARFERQDLAHEPVRRRADPLLRGRGPAREPATARSSRASSPGPASPPATWTRRWSCPRTRCATSTASTRSTRSSRARSRDRGQARRARGRRGRDRRRPEGGRAVAVPLAGRGAARRRAGRGDGRSQRRPMTLAELCVKRGVFAVMLIAFLVVLGRLLLPRAGGRPLPARRSRHRQHQRPAARAPPRRR